MTRSCSNQFSVTKRKLLAAKRREQYAVTHAAKNFDCPRCIQSFSTDELYKQHYKEAHANLQRPKPNVTTGANVISTA